MSETMNRKLEAARIRLELNQQQTNIYSSQYRLLQIQEEAERINVNIAAATSAMEELQKQLNSMEKG